MKKFKFFVIVVLMVIISNNLFAQANNETIPQSATTFLNKNYPGAKIKKWKINDGQYIVTALVDGQKSDIVFDGDGTWVTTETQIKHQNKLPEAIKEGYHKSGYYAWRVSKVLKVKNNDGEYYKMVVDNGNLMVDATNQFPLPTYKLLEFNPNGKLIDIIDNTNAPVPYSATILRNQ